ncbi:hypothetical protein AA0472_2362 [Acetobacter estunensis NRIC 0472]|uniref:Uncharacterized protein n=1 Tax=Acetobacter estunensis TaxID=104097 RepID=A0A967BET0_9PROT|nr:hypothetical protein [Acetobacter estunensis]NHO55187.1 hypothetical protein [Acetobacter estunensis]GBQ27240.1 hypothetical protein AA0472_2362 [Acetobacter estunensis NRIC 0472]
MTSIISATSHSIADSMRSLYGSQDTATSSEQASGTTVSRQKSSDESVTITLSTEATTKLSQTSATVSDGQVAYYAQFFPTRDGTASTLAAAIVDPGATTISTGLSPDEIAKAARASMDAEYASMTASGKPYDINSEGGVDEDTLMSGLDRSALTAVATNEDGLFTKDEQNIAQSFMIDQEGFAMGLYEGPNDLKSKFIDPFLGNSSARAQADVNFLDKASDYEKGSISWVFSRASAELVYEDEFGKSSLPNDTDQASPFSIVKLILQGMKTMKSNNPSVWTKEDLLAEPWMKGLGGELENLLALQKKKAASTGATS